MFEIRVKINTGPNLTNLARQSNKTQSDTYKKKKMITMAGVSMIRMRKIKLNRS